MSKTSVCKITIVATIILGTLGACSSSEDDDLALSHIAWQSCSGNNSIDCGTLTVPVDYAVPDGEKIELSLRRLVASNGQSNRILLLNPGGPGESGVKNFDNGTVSDFLPARLLEEFTIIAFDPRGVGESKGVSCNELDFSNRDFFPIADTDIQNHVNTATDLANKCFEKYGDYLLHLGTNNVVRDMDEIRKVSGAEKIDFIGYSYGSRLGAVYLQTYPENSGAFVLDGVVSPESTTASVAVGLMITAMRRSLETLLDNCIDGTIANCDGAYNVGRLEDRIEFLMSAIRTRVLPAEFNSFEALGEELGLALDVTFDAVDDYEFGTYVRGPLLEYLKEFNLTPLTSFRATFRPETEDGAYETPDTTDKEAEDITPLVAILCADDSERPTTDSLSELLEKLNDQNNLFAERAMPLAAYCTGWKPALTPLASIASSVAPAALLIGGTADEITPIEMLFEMRDAIGALAITSDHIGHTVVFGGQSTCVDDQVLDFLIDGMTPIRTQCPLE